MTRGSRFIAHSSGPRTLVGSSYVAIAMSTTTDDPSAIELPNRVYLDWLRAVVDTIAGASAITWYISEDADGDIPVTGVQVSQPLAIGRTTTTSGGLTTLIRKGWSLSNVTKTPGTLYLQVKLDAGSAYVSPQLHWVKESWSGATS